MYHFKATIVSEYSILSLRRCDPKTATRGQITYYIRFPDISGPCDKADVNLRSLFSFLSCDIGNDSTYFFKM